MKNKIVEVTASDLNAFAEVVIDTEMSITGKIKDNRIDATYETLYPGRVEFQNSTGEVILFNTYSSDDEYLESQIQSQYFDYIPMEPGEIIESETTIRIKKIVFKRKFTDYPALNDMTVKLINYRKF